MELQHLWNTKKQLVSELFYAETEWVLPLTLLLYKVTFCAVYEGTAHCLRIYVTSFFTTPWHWEAINQIQFQIFQKGSVMNTVWIKMVVPDTVDYQ